MRVAREKYLNKLIQKRHNPYIKIITGIRRCGKSYLLKELYREYLLSEGVKEDHIVIIELDDDRFEELRDKKKLREYVEQQCTDNDEWYYIMIDEVQLAKDFEGSVVSLNNHKNYDVYISGSNSEFLSGDISTRFRDRGVEIRIHPLSYSEFYEAYEGDKHFALRDYLYFGGMPYLVNETDEHEKLRYLSGLVENTYLRDVIERNKVKNQNELGELFDVLCSTTGSLVNPSSLANTMMSLKHTKLDVETIHKYMKYLENAFIFEEAKRFNIKGKKYISQTFKMYPEDVGLRNARINFRQIDIGFGIECVVYNELRSRGYLVDVGILETRERNTEGKQIYKQKEIDFVARDASKEYYIQVMDKMPEGTHGHNEYDNLLKVPGAFRKIAIVNEPIRLFVDENGITFISLEEFLLNDNSLNL